MLMALMFQKLILPLLPTLHAGHGLLFNDPIYFHTVASTLAEKIRASGWSAWQFSPDGVGGHIGILAALYATMGPDPAWFIPINAAAHATGALMIYKLGPTLLHGRAGMVGGFVAALCFLVFPSALQWYGQNLKDAFAIAGLLMMLYSQMRALTGGGLSVFPLTVAGAGLLATVKPDFLIIVVVGFGASWLIVVLALATQGRVFKERSALVRGLILTVIVGMFSLSATRIETVSDKIVVSDTTTVGWVWKDSGWAPEFVERQFRRVSKIRAHFVMFNRTVAAGSEIDGDRLPRDLSSMIGYLPRALAIGLFAPFPTSWQDKVSAPRLIGAIETSIWYLFFPGVLLLLFRRPSLQLLFGGCFAFFILLVLSYIHPNVGTLYRQRFGLWMFVLLAGSVGWASVLLPWIKHVGSGGVVSASLTQSKAEGVDSLVARGSLVLMITLICYLGFLARDLLLVSYFGATSMMDGFFFAAMLPMFFVTCFSMPLADAMTRAFVEINDVHGVGAAGSMARALLWRGLVGMFALTLLLGIFAEPLIELGLKGADPGLIQASATMLRAFLPLLLLSVWTVVGNAVLNGMQHSRFAALAQLVVPVTAITAIIVSPFDYGPYPAIAGMVFGTLVNAGLVAWYLFKLGVTLWPAPSAELPKSIGAVYKRLSLAAFFGASITYIGYFLAGTLQVGGAISIWALANKMVTLFSGLASVGVVSIALPHFSRLVRAHSTQLRHPVHFLLIIGNWIGGSAALLVSIFSLPIAYALFPGKDEQIVTFANVIRIGALQLPIAIAFAILMKMSGVIGTSTQALVSSMIALVVNVLLALLLMSYLGILGLAVASLGAVVLGTLYLSIAVRKPCRLGINDVLMLALGWIAWSGVSLAISTDSWAAIICAFVSLAVLVWSQIRNLSIRAR